MVNWDLFTTTFGIVLVVFVSASTVSMTTWHITGSAHTLLHILPIPRLIIVIILFYLTGKIIFLFINRPTAYNIYFRYYLNVIYVM